jgi:ribonuclease P protein component
VVSRKVHKSAVVRNRIRRRLFAIIREVLPGDLPPFDLVFTVFSDRVAEVKSDELRQTVVLLLKKAGLS